MQSESKNYRFYAIPNEFKYNIRSAISMIKREDTKMHRHPNPNHYKLVDNNVF